jgi:hypothetical protein
MKMVRIADTIHPKFHAPTVIPGDISTNRFCEFWFNWPSRLPNAHTCDPSIMERCVVDNINLWEASEKDWNSQETAHYTLCVAETSVSAVSKYSPT